MKVNEVKRRLVAYMGEGSPRRTPFLWGPPGVGKSSIVFQVGRELGLEVIDLRLAQIEPVDLRGVGVPDRERRVVEWYRPEFIPAEGRGILFLDELNMAHPEVQKAAFQLVLDKRVGKHKLGEGWRIIAAGNTVNVNVFAQGLPAPLATRFDHIRVDVDVEEVVEYGIQNGWAEEVIAFLKFRPDFVLKVPEDPLLEGGFPCPRSWEFLSEKISSLKANGIEISVEDIEGCIGKAAAVDFKAFLEVYERLPDVERVFAGEQLALPAKDRSIAVAFATAVALRVRKEKLEEVVRWLVNLSFDDGRRADEIAVMAMQLIWRRFGKKVMMALKGWREFAVKYGELVI